MAARAALEHIERHAPEIAQPAERAEKAQLAETERINPARVKAWQKRRRVQPGGWPRQIAAAGLARAHTEFAARGIAEARWLPWCLLSVQMAHHAWRDGVAYAPAAYAMGVLRALIAGKLTKPTAGVAPSVTKQRSPRAAEVAPAPDPALLAEGLRALRAARAAIESAEIEVAQ